MYEKPYYDLLDLAVRNVLARGDNLLQAEVLDTLGIEWADRHKRVMGTEPPLFERVRHELIEAQALARRNPTIGTLNGRRFFDLADGAPAPFFSVHDVIGRPISKRYR